MRRPVTTEGPGDGRTGRSVLLVPPLGASGRLFHPFLWATDVAAVCNVYAQHLGPGFNGYATKVIDHARQYDPSVCMAGSFGASCVLAALQAGPDLFDHIVFLLPAMATQPQPRNAAYHQALLQSRDIRQTMRIIVERFPDLRRHLEIPESVARAIHRPAVQPLYAWLQNRPPVTDPAALAHCGARVLFVTQPDDPDHDVNIARELSGYFPNSRGVVVTEDRWDYLLRPAVLTPVIDEFFRASGGDL